MCPVECFHYDDQMIYIDPDVCIDCGGCVPACPVNAIYDEFNLPEPMRHWVSINRQKSKELPTMTEPADPLPTAEQRRTELELALS